MPTPMVRKVLLLDPELWGRIEDFRFACRIPTEAEAIRRLLQVGLKAELAKALPDAGA